MGNKLFTTPPNDCCGPEITSDEIKKLTFVGFTKDELNNLYMEDKKKDNKTAKKKERIKY